MGVRWIKVIKWNITQPLKRRKILPFAKMWMNLEGIMLSKISQREKDKYYMIIIICRIFREKKKSQAHRKKVEKWLPEAEEMGEMERGWPKCKVSVIRYIGTEY